MARSVVSCAAAGFGVWLTAGGMFEYYWKRHHNELRAIGLRRDIAALEDKLQEQKQQMAREAEELELEKRTLSDMLDAAKELWEERINRYEQMSEVADQYGELLPFVQWQWQRLERLYQLVTDRLLESRNSLYGEYEWISARVHNMNLALPPEAFDESVRIHNIHKTVPLLRSTADRDPMLVMLEASISHMDEVPSMASLSNALRECFVKTSNLAKALQHGDGTRANLERMLEKFPRTSVGELFVPPLNDRDDIDSAVKQIVMAHGVIVGAPDTPEKQEAINCIERFGIMVGDRRIAQQAFDIKEAYMSTLVQSLTG